VQLPQRLQDGFLVRSLFSYSYKSLFPPALRLDPLFSHTYKPLGGQLLCIHIHTNCRGVPRVPFREYFAANHTRRTGTNHPFGEPAQAAVYFSYRDLPADQGEIHLRTRSGNESALASEARAVLRDLDAMLPLYDVRTFSQHIERNLFLRRIPARMFAVLGPLLLGLAAIGIYAVVSYAVARRTREIGVRLTFGATSGRVVLQILRENMGAVTWGAGIGWIVAFVISVHAISKGAVNLPVFIGVPSLLLGCATLACWIPARRASRIDPMAALRHE
jgi:hypothetical protein